jgi:hypothetical protein
MLKRKRLPHGFVDPDDPEAGLSEDEPEYARGRKAGHHGRKGSSAGGAAAPSAAGGAQHHHLLNAGYNAGHNAAARTRPTNNQLL